MDKRDISTAPRDGTRVLVYVPPISAPEDRMGEIIMETRVNNEQEWVSYTSGWFTAWFEDGQWHTGLRDHVDSSSALDREPTHWMPLPADPI